MNRETAKRLKAELKNSYQAIAGDFSSTREKPWPLFDELISRIPKGSKVLDLGCGNGRLYGALKSLEVDYTGVDFCSALLEIARRKYPQQHFVEQDITELEMDGHFDVVVSIAAFHHIPSRQMREEVLGKVFEALRDDGTLFLSVWDLWQIKYWRAFLKSFSRVLFQLLRHDPRDVFISFGKEKVPRYYHAFLPFELRGLLTQAGFTIQEHWRSGRNLVFV
ncbi:MAG: methyltransferase domain-containing protein, partial [bacterium]|nr:methyltransferase domain-containing protein [bacterium]